MHLLLLALLIALLPAPLPAIAADRPAPPGIIGHDDRRVIDPKLRMWDAVGRLNLEHGGFCTATLIAPAEILTAAHCLWDRARQRWSDPSAVHFVPGYRRGRYLGHARGTAFRLAPGLEMNDEGYPDRLRDDWAIVELDLDLQAGAGIRPIPLGAGANRAMLETLPLARGGYGADRPHLPVMIEPCHALGLAEQGRVLLHDCDATQGDSGSPILARREDDYVLVGVQTAVVNRGPDVAGLAILMERVVPAAELLLP